MMIRKVLALIFVLVLVSALIVFAWGRLSVKAELAQTQSDMTLEYQGVEEPVLAGKPVVIVVNYVPEKEVPVRIVVKISGLPKQECEGTQCDLPAEFVFEDVPAGYYSGYIRLMKADQVEELDLDFTVLPIPTPEPEAPAAPVQPVAPVAPAETEEPAAPLGDTGQEWPEGCPSDDAVQADLVGLEVQMIGSCAYKWNDWSTSFSAAPCPDGYQCTLDVGPLNITVRGDGKWYRVSAATYWPLQSNTAYNPWLSDAYQAWAHEAQFGQIHQDPQYPIYVGIDYPAADQIAANNSDWVIDLTPYQVEPPIDGRAYKIVGFAPAAAPTGATGTCPTDTADIASLIGGDASNWTLHEPGKFTYSGSATTFTWPGFGILDGWANGGPVSLTASGTFVNDVATFRCDASIP